MYLLLAAFDLGAFAVDCSYLKCKHRDEFVSDGNVLRRCDAHTLKKNSPLFLFPWSSGDHKTDRIGGGGLRGYNDVNDDTHYGIQLSFALHQLSGGRAIVHQEN